MPGRFVCSGSMEARFDDARAKAGLAGTQPLAKLFTKEQRSFVEANAPAGIGLGDLARLGPTHVLKLKFVPAQLARRLVAELWFYPHGSRLLELSTKCAPSEAFQVAAETRALLTEHGIDISGKQATTTRTALEYFSGVLARASEPVAAS